MDSPSLKNSHTHGYNLSLRRTDQALHDTTKSFVESLSKDIRISQHADIVYACKRMENEKWYWLQPLTGGRTGYLIFLPRQPTIWMDEQCKQSFRIPMRVGHTVYERKTVFLASLNRTDGMLRIEDCWLLAGEFLRAKSFSERWNKVLHFYDCLFKPDPVLQQGLQIEPAIYEPLSHTSELKEKYAMVFAQGETAPRRLRVQFYENTLSKPYTPPTHKKIPIPLSSNGQKQPQIQKQKNTDAEENKWKYMENSSIARIKAHEEYPDTYNLWIQGVKKGYAAVQDLALSRKLRSVTKEKESEEVYVNVEWNDEFKMYEITGIAS